MATPEVPERGRIRVYSRPGCHLCEELIEELLPLIRDRLDLEVVDVDTRPDWKREYGSKIPLVEYDGATVCRYYLDTAAIRVIVDSLPAA